MLWCDGLHCGWGNHTTACHDEAMALQETHLDSGPNYTKKDGSFNPAALICNCCGKTRHQFKHCPHVGKPGAAERIAEGIFRVENKKTRAKNNVDAVNSLLVAKGVDMQNLSFNRDLGDVGPRSGTLRRQPDDLPQLCHLPPNRDPCLHLPRTWSHACCRPYSCFRKTNPRAQCSSRPRPHTSQMCTRPVPALRHPTTQRPLVHHYPQYHSPSLITLALP